MAWKCRRGTDSTERYVQRLAKVLRRSRSLLSVFLIGAIWVTSANSPAAQRNSRNGHEGAPPHLWLEDLQCGFDLGADGDLTNLVRMAGLWIELSRAQEAKLEADRKRLEEALPLEKMSYEQLKDYFALPSDYITPKERQGLEEIQRWTAEALNEPAGLKREQCFAWILELGTAINNDHRSVAPERLAPSDIPRLLRQYVHNPVATGKRPAADINGSFENDLSRAAPAPSDFWQAAGSIAAQDLYFGYGRSALPDLTNGVWTY